MQVNSSNGGTSACAPRFGRFEFGIIKRKAAQLIGRGGYTQWDRPDLEHELWVRLLRAKKRFNPAVGHWKCFVTAVVERAAINLLRDGTAAKRDHRRISSLNVTIVFDEDESYELGDTVSDREHNRRRCCDPRNAQERADLLLDLAEFFESLPPDLRILGERLKNESVSAISRATGIPRTTIQDFKRRLRQRFERAGLRDYLNR